MRRHANRTCGGCTACCTRLGILAINKPSNTTCPHECAAGCAVYANRPQTCRTYACLWHAGLLPDRFRPDQCGVLLSAGRHGGEVKADLLSTDPALVERAEYLWHKLRDDYNFRQATELLIVPYAFTADWDTTIVTQSLKEHVHLVVGLRGVPPDQKLAEYRVLRAKGEISQEDMNAVEAIFRSSTR